MNEQENAANNSRKCSRCVGGNFVLFEEKESYTNPYPQQETIPCPYCLMDKVKELELACAAKDAELGYAKQLAHIACDWDLGTDGQVEIIGLGWVSCNDLAGQFNKALSPTIGQELMAELERHRKACEVQRLQKLAEDIACSLYGYYEGGSAGSTEAMQYFQNNKTLGGPKHTIERVLAILNAALTPKSPTQ